MFQAPPPPPLTHVVVHSGDTMSGIAEKYDTNWPAVEEYSKVADPNLIYPGQVLLVPAGDQHNPGYTPKHSSGIITDASTSYAPRHAALNTDPSSPASVSTAGMGSFQACVISRESGGQTQVMNSSGHYGLYQFSESTWTEYGGNPADFGHASAAEQTQVFDNAMATPYGASNWAPYDGC